MRLNKNKLKLFSSDPILSKEDKDDVVSLIDRALKEDIRSGDITSNALISTGETVSHRLILKKGGRLAGLPFLETIYHAIDPKIEINLFVEEGSEHRGNTLLGTISGPARSVFQGRMVALNLLQHTCGIATLTAEYVERVEGNTCDILDTRKTIPGLRALEKYAVRVGGGKNHRKGLDDRFIIKHYHLSFIAKEARHPIIEAVRRIRAQNEEAVVGVEVTDSDMVKEALKAKVDLILLDRMTLTQARRAVAQVKGQAYVQVVGTVLADQAHLLAQAGVNGISIPALTYKAPPLDITLRY